MVLNVPTHLAIRPKDNKVPAFPLWFQYQQFTACQTAIKTWEELKRTNRWTYASIVQSDIIDLFVSTSSFSTTWKAAFQYVPLFPEMEKWLSSPVQDHNVIEDTKLWGQVKPNLKELTNWISEHMDRKNEEEQVQKKSKGKEKEKKEKGKEKKDGKGKKKDRKGKSKDL